jgi:hypothetical protein
MTSVAKWNDAIGMRSKSFDKFHAHASKNPYIRRSATVRDDQRSPITVSGTYAT